LTSSGEKKTELREKLEEILIIDSANGEKSTYRRVSWYVHVKITLPLSIYRVIFVLTCSIGIMSLGDSKVVIALKSFSRVGLSSHSAKEPQQGWSQQSPSGLQHD
jgi:hypothetical protein